MNYTEALDYVLAEKQERRAAWAFVPFSRGGKVAGGSIYVVCYFEPDPDEPEDVANPYGMWYSRGEFHDSSGEGGFFHYTEIPEEAKSLDYAPTTTFESGGMEYETQVVVRLLQGVPKEDAMEDDED